MSVVSAGKALAAGLLCGSGSPAAVTILSYGTGTNAVAAGDTGLQTQSQRLAATPSLVTTTVTNDTAQLTKTFSITGTEAISEIGAHNSLSGATLFARATSTDGHFTLKNVTNGDSFALTYKCKCA